jgi:lactate dehydrogenase-like 2-hydroxyacid dehydrogenase
MGSKPVITVGRKLPAAIEQRLGRDYVPRLNADDRLYSREEFLALCEGADGVLVCHTEHLDAAAIHSLPDSVRMIANFSVGYDHVDVAAARERGLTVTNTPDVLSDATAEIALLLTLAAARRAGEGERLVRAAGWNTWSPAFMVGTQVTGKRFGIIGMGRVGKVTARRARGFDMQVLYHNRSRLPEAEEHGAIYFADLHRMLPECDILSIHCPASEQTRGMIDAERIALLPDGAVVVNTSRGAIVDDDALIAALRGGKLSGAGLDVFNGEPDDIHPGYRELDNVYLLPHIGSATRETRDAMGHRALDNMDAFFAGREPRDRVA